MKNEITLALAVLILALAATVNIGAQEQPTIMKDWVDVQRIYGESPEGQL